MHLGTEIQARERPVSKLIQKLLYILILEPFVPRKFSHFSTGTDRMQNLVATK